MEDSESKTPQHRKISHNQSLGYRKFTRSLNVRPLFPAMLSPNLGKCAVCQNRGNSPTGLLFIRTLTVARGDVDVMIKE